MSVMTREEYAEMARHVALSMLTTIDRFLAADQAGDDAERLDLVVLCADCHAKHHGKQP